MSSKVDEIVQEVRRLAAEHPDFIYKLPAYTDRCLYVNPDLSKGSCIVGQAILNTTLEKHKSHVYMSLLEFDTRDKAVIAEDAVRELVNTTREDKISIKWIDLVQGYQDQGISWNMAIQLADQYFAE